MKGSDKIKLGIKNTRRAVFLNGTSVVCTLWISSCVKVQIHSTLQLYIHVENQAPAPAPSLANSSASPVGGHTQPPSPSSGSRPVGTHHCSQQPSEMSRGLHLLLPCQSKTKQNKEPLPHAEFSQNQLISFPWIQFLHLSPQSFRGSQGTGMARLRSCWALGPPAGGPSPD